MRLYVGNLSFNSDEAGIERLFGGFGTVDSVHMVRDQATGRSRGFAFVEMSDDTAAKAAIDALHDREFEGRRLTVNEARPQERRGGGGGFGGNRSGGGFNRGGGGGGGRRESRW